MTQTDSKGQATPVLAIHYLVFQTHEGDVILFGQIDRLARLN